MSRLFQPISFKSVTSKNRIMVSPMCQYSSEDGFATDWHLVHLGSRAVGGAGIVFTEGTAVSPEGRISYADLGIWKDEHIDGLKRITDFIKEQGSVPGIQIAHAGRKSSKKKTWEGTEQAPLKGKGWETLAPSAIPYQEGYREPIEISKDQIERVINDFREATRRAYEAGFQIIELHGAHGYLIHTFLSPATNKRTDEYGGSFENRTRFALQVFEAVRDEWPDELPVFIRISADDWLEEECWTIDQSVKLAKLFKKAGVDLIDVSSGGLSPKQNIDTGAGYQTGFAARIRREAGIATGAVGMITTPPQAETIVRTGQADLVIMAREFLRNPYFPYRAARELHAHDFEWPKQYERAKL